MALFRQIPESQPTEQVIDTFAGYNHNLKIGDGEFYDMKNLTSDFYPLMGNRARKSIVQLKTDDGTVLHFDKVYGMVADTNGDLFVIAKAKYEPNEQYTDDTSPQLYRVRNGVVLNFTATINNNSVGEEATFEEMVLTEDEKRIFACGAELYIFPDKWRVSTYVGGGSLGSWVSASKLEVNKVISASQQYPIKFTPCDKDGNEFGKKYVQNTEPADKVDGMIWVDTSETIHVYKKWVANQWVIIPDVYVKVDVHVPKITSGDGIELDIDLGTSASNEQVKALNGPHIVVSEWVGFIVITGLLDNEYNQSDGYIRIERKVPDMDYVIQCQNRLWGCKFKQGPDPDENINEIYASALGKFERWNTFQGISTDSYVASVGTPGKWTGAVNLGGYPVFFKEDHFHKVYVSSSGAHQIIDKPCHGVKDGCSGSIGSTGDVCYYLSRQGIMGFDGTTFSNNDYAFGGEAFTDAEGGIVGDKYYVSMADSTGNYAIYAYDTRRGLWHKEDSTKAEFFTSNSSDAFFFSNGELFCFGDNGKLEEPVEWEAVTGLQGYTYTGEKYISRFNLRMQLPRGSSMDVLIEYDSSGEWEYQYHIDGVGTKNFTIPVRPRRCDHFRIKLKGKGDIRLYSFSKLFEGGSDIC